MWRKNLIFLFKQIDFLNFDSFMFLFFVNFILNVLH